MAVRSTAHRGLAVLPFFASSPSLRSSSVWRDSAVARETLRANRQLRDAMAAKSSEGSFKLLFDNNPVPMWLWDASENLPIVDMNQAALSHLGYSKEDLPHLTVFDLLSEEEGPALKAMLAAGIHGPYRGERVLASALQGRHIAQRFAVYLHPAPFHRQAAVHWRHSSA